jgi:16S rRNA (adenine1518-N6/adenine1519-N6)-dimethyltransferase
MGVRSQLVNNEPMMKKRFGQHFLRDKGVISRIIRWIDPGPDDLFLEIGAGDGALSTQLAPQAARLLAIELDVDCIPILESKLSPHKSAVVIQADFLQLNPADLLSGYGQAGRPLRIAGNLPYNIATAIIDILLHSTLPIEDMHFMLQLEVAQRITAAPGSRDYGYLSVDCQHHCEVRMGFKVPPACFVPRPKVSSATISFRPKRAEKVHAEFERHFEAIAKAAFSYRRKTLANSLGKNPVYGKISGELLEQAGIDGSRRAEQLSVPEYEHLAETYLKHFEKPEAGSRKPE